MFDIINLNPFFLNNLKLYNIFLSNVLICAIALIIS